MQTRRLFYEDPWQREFEAEVVACTRSDAGYLLELDRTLFYPEGGGQPADRGVICVKDRALTVEDVQEAGDGIVHTVSGPVEPGTKIRGEIDWEYRFDLMQQHSGEHIVSGMIHEEYGYDNVGFHMGAEFITIDLSGILDMDQIAGLEEKVNKYIWTDRRTEILYPDEKERISLDYRSKKELTGQVRLVSFPGADLCACCGLHVETTGQIGLVKIISCKKFREGVRIEMLSGRRAFEYMNTHVRENSGIGTLLSAKDHETREAVDRLLKEIYELKGELIREQKKTLAFLTEKCRGAENVVLLAPGLDSAMIRKCTDGILDDITGTGAVFSGDDREGYRYALGIREGDIRNLVKDMNQELNGRGGGKPVFAQGSVKADREEIRRYFTDKGYTVIEG